MNMPITTKDIFDLRMKLIDVAALANPSPTAFFAAFVNNIGELLAMADAFVKVQKLSTMEVDPNELVDLRFFKKRVHDVIEEFHKLLAKSRRLELGE
jgi:hypothetical protein